MFTRSLDHKTRHARPCAALCRASTPLFSETAVWQQDVDGRNKSGHDGEPMRLTKRKNQTACGVACLAMLAGVSCADVERVLFGKNHNGTRLPDQIMMIKALKRFGILTTKHLTRSSKNQTRINLRQDALIRTNVLANGNWHWAVWDSGQQNLLAPYYKRPRPYSCLVVLRRGRRRTSGAMMDVG